MSRMTREEAKNWLNELYVRADIIDEYGDMVDMQPYSEAIDMAIEALEQDPKTGHCKDCKWWKDSDGTYRRGVHAESQCPINRREVLEGNGYCYVFEPQEREEDE